MYYGKEARTSSISGTWHLQFPQVQMCEPEHTAAGICSHTALPQTRAAATYLGDTPKHSFSSEKEEAYQ